MPGNTLTVTSHYANETKKIGALLGKTLQCGDVVCLQGDLGSGKTNLTQGIGQGMRITETITSPTFVFIREHCPEQGNLCLYHVDLYRIENPIDAVALGLVEYLYGDGVTVIEWAERARELMPKNCLWVEIDILHDTQRNLTFKAFGPRYIALLDELQTSLIAACLLPACSVVGK